jgi:hypothetical protein
MAAKRRRLPLKNVYALAQHMITESMSAEI